MRHIIEANMPALPLQVSGTVIHGDKVGRTIGFPTANLMVSLSENDIEPGVYVGECDLSLNKNLPPELQKTWKCLPYFGPRLIFGEVINSFEVYIYDFDFQIYDLVLNVKVEKKLRDPMDLKSLEALKAQLEQDKLAGATL